MTIAPPGPKTGNALIIDNAQLIGGEWVPAADGATIDVVNPANGEVLARVPRGGAADVDAAVRAAEKSRFINSGQCCLAAKRFVVHTSVAAEFGRRFAEAVAG